MIPIKTKLKGVKFGDCQENIKLYAYPSFATYELTREINNPHDPNAVYVGIGHYRMGYLPMHVAQVIAPLIDVGKTFVAEFVSLNTCPPHETLGLTVRIVEITN